MASWENAQLINGMRTAPPLRGASVEEWREEFVTLYASFPVPDHVKREPVVMGGVPAEWFRGAGESGKAILYLHGGGYVLGSTDSHRALIAQIAAAAEIDVLALNYRLAPEHRFPAAIEDALSAFKALSEGGYHPSDIAVAGDSAGAGLTAGLLVALRDLGLRQPRCAVLISGWYDLTMSGASHRRNRDSDPLVQPEVLTAMAQFYCAAEQRLHSWVSPLQADLTGLPPMLIQASAHEVLSDDSIELAARARARGVDVTLDLEDEVVHVWHQYSHAHPEGKAAIGRLADYVRRRLRPE